LNLGIERIYAKEFYHRFNASFLLVAQAVMIATISLAAGDPDLSLSR
jgi:hypothetical protein